jgi:hypothetical protein
MFPIMETFPVMGNISCNGALSEIVLKDGSDASLLIFSVDAAGTDLCDAANGSGRCDDAYLVEGKGPRTYITGQPILPSWN